MPRNQIAIVFPQQVGTEEEEEDEGGEKKDKPKLKTPTVDVIENFLLVLGHLYLKDQRYRDDFRVALVKSQSRLLITTLFLMLVLLRRRSSLTTFYGLYFSYLTHYKLPAGPLRAAFMYCFNSCHLGTNVWHIFFYGPIQ